MAKNSEETAYYFFTLLQITLTMQNSNLDCQRTVQNHYASICDSYWYTHAGITQALK